MALGAFTDRDKRTIRKIRNGDKDSLDQLYLDALPAVKDKLGDTPKADKYLQKELMVVRKAIIKDVNFTLPTGQSLKDYLVNAVTERWDELQENKQLDKKIMDALSGDDENGWAFYYMQRYYFPWVKHLVMSNGGSEDDAKDIIMDSIEALLKNIREGKYTLQDSARLKTYFLGICKNKWRDYVKKRKRSIIDTLIEGVEPIDEDSYDYMAYDHDVLSERQKVVAEVFKQASEKCHKILAYFYYDNLSHQEIAERMGYEGPNTSKEQKKRCMNKLRAAIVKKFKHLSL